MATIKHPILPPTMTKAAYSVNDTLRLLGIGRTHLYRQIQDGKLKALKSGRRTLIPATEIAAFLDRLEPMGGRK
ncbi:MAG: helix-turn-helix domain-containing protein [Pigmentiphaga sp.]